MTFYRYGDVPSAVSAESFELRVCVGACEEYADPTRWDGDAQLLPTGTFITNYAHYNGVRTDVHVEKSYVFPQNVWIFLFFIHNLFIIYLLFIICKFLFRK